MKSRKITHWHYRFSSVLYALALAAAAGCGGIHFSLALKPPVPPAIPTDLGNGAPPMEPPDSPAPEEGTTAAIPALPGGRFAFVYPNFTGAVGAMTPAEFVTKFAGAMHNPNVFDQWERGGHDIRRLNPQGFYLNHVNLRTIDRTSRNDIEGHPDYQWIHQNHPEWILRDVNGQTVPLFLPSEEMLDFGNDAYIDWVVNTWFPRKYALELERGPMQLSWFLHDNGELRGRAEIQCAPRDTVCLRYTTDEGVQSAWEKLLGKLRSRWPNIRVALNSGPVVYRSVEVQMEAFRRVFAHTDGYFSECLVDAHCYWQPQAKADKRVALRTTMALADWLAAQNKIFFPNLGMYDNEEPQQSVVDYAWAFFNLVRNGDRQFFSRVTKDASGMWQPRVYPEMNLALGDALEPATEISPGVYRRRFGQAIAYVNISDDSVSIPLPPGGPYRNSRGAVVAFPLNLGSFSGLTIYR